MKLLLDKHIYTPINSFNERSTVIVLFIIKIKDVNKVEREAKRISGGKILHLGYTICVIKAVKRDRIVTVEPFPA